MNPEYAITLVSEHGSENRQKIIDCMKVYLQSMPVHLKETKQDLTSQFKEKVLLNKAKVDVAFCHARLLRS